MSFGESIATCLAKYATFSGRASRSEYWWFYLFTLLMQWGSLLVDPSGQLGGLVAIVFLLPNWAAAVRRLHDTGRSGWWLLIGLTIIGMIPLLIWFAMPGHDAANGYDAESRRPKSRGARASSAGLPLFRYTAYSAACGGGNAPARSPPAMKRMQQPAWSQFKRLLPAPIRCGSPGSGAARGQRGPLAADHQLV